MITNSCITRNCSPETEQKQNNVQKTKRAPRAIRFAWVALAALAWGCPPLHAAMLVRQMDLTALSKNADAIVRATVVDIEAGSVRAGGGNIPTITYRLQAKETVAGATRGIFTVTMVGELKSTAKVGGATRVPAFSDMPALKRGQEYLLFTTRPSSAGLSTTVGLGQGCFTVYAQDKKEFAVNLSNNAGLSAEPAGPVEYTRLVKQIRELRASELSAKGKLPAKGELPAELPVKGEPAKRELRAK
jgi:hypothetical protein